MDMNTAIPLGFALVLTGFMGWVIVSDATRYIISNRLNLLLLLLFIPAAFLLPVSILPSLGAAALMFACGLAMFALGIMGGGDAKLLTVLALWIGWGIQLMVFLFMTAVAGGVLVVVVLLLRAFLPSLLLKRNPTRILPRLLTRKEPIPYGLAIAFGFLWLLWVGGIPALAGIGYGA